MAKPPEMFRQSGVVPWRQGADGLEVLMVTSRKGTRWVLPKGIVEPDMTPAESAANEAWEEAGVKGDVAERPLGTYRYKKWGGTCTVELFAMRVTEELAAWPEAGVRTRAWLPLDEARRRVGEQELSKILEGFARRIGAA